MGAIKTCNTTLLSSGWGCGFRKIAMMKKALFQEGLFHVFIGRLKDWLKSNGYIFGPLLFRRIGG